MPKDKQKFVGLDKWLTTGERPGAPQEARIGVAPARNAVGNRVKQAVLNSGLYDQPLVRILLGGDAAKAALFDPMQEVTPEEAIGISTGPRAGAGSLAGALKAVRGQVGKYAVTPRTMDRLKYFLDLGENLPRRSVWSDKQDELLKAFGGNIEDARQWFRLFGATSPNTDVVRNTIEATMAQRPVLVNPSYRWSIPDAQAAKPVITMAPSKVKNINRALEGQPLSGDKVEAMSGYMIGEPRIPIDVHGLYGIGSTKSAFTEEIPALRAFMSEAEGRPSGRGGGFTSTDLYYRAENAILDALEKLRGRSARNQAWGDAWEGVRSEKRLPFQGGPQEMLQRRGLMIPGGMRNPDLIDEALRQPRRLWIPE